VEARQALPIFCLLVFTQTLFAQSFVLTETTLAESLGISKREMEKQSKELSRYISGDHALIRKCKTTNSDDLRSLCDFVLALEAAREDEKKSNSKQARFYHSTPNHINEKTFYRAQRAKPGELLDVMKDYTAQEVMSWLPKLLLTKGCPQNLLIASLRMYEVALPSEKAQASLEVGYRRVLSCLEEDDPYYELTHQRQGLLRYYWGDKVGAIQSLKLALKGDTQKAKEATLFWIGYLEDSPKVKRVYWDHLLKEFPLSFHALSAAKLIGKDPYETFVQKPLLKPQRVADENFSQLSIRWLEALYMYNEAKNAVRMSYRVTKRFDKNLSPANLAYIAALANKYGKPDEAMQLSMTLIRQNPELINSQTLKYIYPTPFEATFARLAKKVDPLLTFSVAKQESGFNPMARSPANARGLLQILPSTAKLYEPKSHKYLYDIDTNVEVGGTILADLITRLGRTEYALAAYNAGYSRVENWKKRYSTENGMLFIDLIPYTETRGYVANVLRNHYWYTSLYGKSKGTYR
jgi:soluble lytic murein transglycosylase-like protein